MVPKGFQVDTISMHKGALRGMGPVAERMLKTGFNINALRTNDILSKDEWKIFDDQVVAVARRRLVGVGALLSNNLRFDVANAMGVTQIEWEQISDMAAAEVSMSGITEGQSDRLTYTLKSMPLPIVHKDFTLNIRHLLASRKRGTGIDTQQAELCSTIVSEAIETHLFAGISLTVAGSTIPGLTTETNRNTGTSANWATNATGANKVADVLAMIDALTTDNMYGPYGLFVSQTAFNLLSDDHVVGYPKTQMQRLSEINGIKFILPSKDLTGKNVVLMQLDNSVAQEVVGFAPTLVQWDSPGGFQVNFKVMSIMAPRVRSTKTSQSGIAHFS